MQVVKRKMDQKIKQFIKLLTSALLVSLIFFSCTASKKSGPVASENRTDNSYAPSSRDANTSFSSSKQSASKKSSKKSVSVYDQKVEEYKKRMRDNAKKNAKIAKEMEKPQYSDPMYFGHKKKPKKRPLNKRKFCKECGIVH